VIGITTYGRDSSGNFYLPSAYVVAVRQAGGFPILLPPGELQVDQILEIVDGLIFAGGGDIAPDFYRGSQHPTISRVDRERDAFELELARRIFSQDIPVLGICRGCQVLNVASRGDLVQHIPEEFDETILHKKGDEAGEHWVDLNVESRLAQIIGQTQIKVVSKHHQGIRKVGDAWKIVGRAADGVVEAMEHQQHPWLMAVLWHPEASLNDPNHQRIFRAFVEAARQSKSKQ
jgi:putative glutamine amidotransferase